MNLYERFNELSNNYFKELNKFQNDLITEKEFKENTENIKKEQEKIIQTIHKK